MEPRSPFRRRESAQRHARVVVGKNPGRGQRCDGLQRQQERPSPAARAARGWGGRGVRASRAGSRGAPGQGGVDGQRGGERNRSQDQAGHIGHWPAPAAAGRLGQTGSSNAPSPSTRRATKAGPSRLAWSAQCASTTSSTVTGRQRGVGVSRCRTTPAATATTPSRLRSGRPFLGGVKRDHDRSEHLRAPHPDPALPPWVCSRRGTGQLLQWSCPASGEDLTRARTLPRSSTGDCC